MLTVECLTGRYIRVSDKCNIRPLGAPGDHTKGLSGCAWCDQSDLCVILNQDRDGSVLFDQDGEGNIELQMLIWKGVNGE